MVGDRENDKARLEYIQTMLQSLVPMAKAADAEMLAYLLEMAVAESHDIRRASSTDKPD